MTLPASGPITLVMIQTEFGGTNPISIDEYYRGGANVPDTATNAAIPTSGAISFDNFHGASADTGGSPPPPPTKTASVSPIYIYTTGTGSKTSASATATGSGGTPSSYLWTRISGDASITINSPTSATTSFAASVAAGNDKLATFKCTITFSDASTAYDTVDVEFDSGV